MAGSNRLSRAPFRALASWMLPLVLAVLLGGCVAPPPAAPSVAAEVILEAYKVHSVLPESVALDSWVHRELLQLPEAGLQEVPDNPAAASALEVFPAVAVVAAAR